MKAKNIFFFIIILSIAKNSIAKEKVTIVPGAYHTAEYFPLLKGKSLGIVANQTSTIRRVHLVDSLKSSGFKIKRVFAPEHGFRGESGAGEKIANSIDKKTGISIVSLYGNHLEPSTKDLAGINLMIFDIQDVGVRFYTYISTLQYVMEACAKHKIPLIILDRPNPNSFYIDGPVLDKKYSSFVGMQSIPVVYGLTIGEYANMLNGEGWLKDKLKCNLTVIKVKDYFHSYRYQLPIPPSPNLPDMDAVYLYPSLCFFEGTAISVGRGTEKPFRYIGFPDTTGGGFLFTPKSIPGVALHPPYEDTLCRGLDLTKEGMRSTLQKSLQLKWLIQMYSAFPEKEKFFNNFFDKLAGTDELRKQIIENKSEADIKIQWKESVDNYLQIRKKYLLYYDYK